MSLRQFMGLIGGAASVGAHAARDSAIPDSVQKAEQDFPLVIAFRRAADSLGSRDVDLVLFGAENGLNFPRGVRDAMDSFMRDRAEDNCAGRGAKAINDYCLAGGSQSAGTFLQDLRPGVQRRARPTESVVREAHCPTAARVTSGMIIRSR
jgi:hypothetical protein